MDAFNRLVDVAARPVPLRTLIIRNLLRRWQIGSYRTRLNVGALDRPHYGMCLYHAAEEAKALGYKAMTAIELGVAAGNGLLCLCEHREQIQKSLGIEINLRGFDSGSGLPSTSDPRDVQYYWGPGAYLMDRPALEKRLAGRAEIIFGDVADTVSEWQGVPGAPIGAIFFDLDLYTSTMAAFKLLTKENVLPRVWCYFDDIVGGPSNAIAEGIGEREAIRQFNLDPERNHLHDILSPAYVFAGKTPEPWHQQIYLYHRLSHPRYNARLTGNRNGH